MVSEVKHQGFCSLERWMLGGSRVSYDSFSIQRLWIVSLDVMTSCLTTFPSKGTDDVSYSTFGGNVNRLYSLSLEQDADPAPQQLQSASQRACLTYQSQVAFFALWSYITLSVITWKECRVHRLLLNLPRLARCQGAVWWSGLRQQVMFGLMLRDQVGRLISVCYWQEVRLLTEGLGRARSSSLCADRRLAPESQDALRRHTRPAWHWHECFLSRWWSLSQHYVE